MPLHQDNSKAYNLIGFDKNLQIEGLDSFAKNIEKHFFSRVTIRNISKIPSQVNLVIELTCNLQLIEVLDHFKKEIWGSFSSKKHSFKQQLKQLKNANIIAVEVEELSIFLEDTAIIINSLYSQSIAQELEKIMNKMHSSFHNFTKDKNEMPYEIYVSVYEENDLKQVKTKDKVTKYNSAQDYFTYWGLYFYSDDDAMVYDLKNEVLIESSLHMHNRCK